jgi:hypothetical protein
VIDRKEAKILALRKVLELQGAQWMEANKENASSWEMKEGVYEYEVGFAFDPLPTNEGLRLGGPRSKNYIRLTVDLGSGVIEVLENKVT